ncbi:MAG: fluoride efflux transporter CrcB [Chloroflexi bacterium]|nr:fluoride efflux transporter CrcB [Chloroflexota bacterium]
MLAAILVGVGGMVGSIARYEMSAWVNRHTTGPGLPIYGTLTVNMLGCLVIGLIAGLAQYKGIVGPNTNRLLVIGILGGFTTFSAFGNETFALFRDDRVLAAMMNVVLQPAIGLACVAVGFGVVRWAAR